MTALRRLILPLLLGFLALGVPAMPALAVQPDEILPDPALEARARVISRQLRCPVCQGETIDDSNAPISRDLRLYLRERLVAGDSDAEVIAAVTDRFGEFVLFAPPARGINWLLYLSGPVMALLGLGFGWRYLRARGGEESRASAESAPLSPEERARIDELTRG